MKEKLWFYKTEGNLMPPLDNAVIYEKQRNSVSGFRPLRKHKIKLNSPMGFTLFEVLMSCFILTVIIAGGFSVFSVGNVCWDIDTGMLDLRQEARLAMDGMIREIRQSKPTAITISNSGNRIDFSISGYSIAYYLQGKQIIREQAGIKRILGNNIDVTEGLNFSFDNACVRIKLKLAKIIKGRNVSFFIVEKVRLRNE